MFVQTPLQSVWVGPQTTGPEPPVPEDADEVDEAVVLALDSDAVVLALDVDDCEAPPVPPVPLSEHEATRNAALATRNADATKADR